MRDNLRTCFPEKTEKELLTLEKRFYHHLCDIMVESIKGFSMSKDEIIKRHRIINPEIVSHYFENKTSIMGVTAHYNNWEWGSFSAGLQLKHKIVALYTPMTNKRINDYVKKSRGKYGCHLASIKNTSTTFNEFSKIPTVYLLAADQSPSNLKLSYWLQFFNRETACLHGPEKYARRYNLPVIYINILKKARGYYELELIPICENPEVLEEGEITKRYFNLMEQIINKEPAYWLWSHRRWKLHKPDQASI